MSLAADLSAPEAQRGERCSIAAILLALDPDDRAALEAAFASTRSHAHIARALNGNGHRVVQQTVRRHRKGECRCPR